MNPQDASQEYLASRVEASDPVRRIVLLHQGAARFTREAIRSIELHDLEQAHHAFVKAKNIILHLLSSIPDSDDSDLGSHLRGLFQFTYTKLVEGNLRKDTRSAEEALQVIRSLGEGWAALDSQGAGGTRAEEQRGEGTYLV